MDSPDFQPILNCDAVIVRPIKPEDWKALFAAASDPEIWKLHPIQDRYREPAFRSYFDSAIASKMAFVFVEPTTGELIGSSRYYGYVQKLSEVEIGWTFIVRKHWGGQINHEVKRLMLHHAFKYVDTVIFWVGEHNWRSQRAVEKIGGIRRGGTAVREATGRVPHVIFEIKKANNFSNCS